MRKKPDHLFIKAVKDTMSYYLGLPEMHYLEGCADCQACAVSCPFYNAVSKRYSPKQKAEWLRKLYRREYTLSGKVLGALVGAWAPRNRDEAVKLVEYAYACSNCGWCYYTCPHGIDSGALIGMLRSVLYRYGEAPLPLKKMAKAEIEIIRGTPWRIQREWASLVEELRERHNAVRAGKSKYMVLLDIYTGLLHRDLVHAYLDVLDAAGYSYAIPDRPLGIRPPLPLTLGYYEAAREVAENVYNYAARNGARVLVVLDGGYPYNDLKYLYPRYRARKPEELEIVHVLEMIYAAYLADGLPAFTRYGRAAYIPSCNIDTRGGLGEARRLVEITAEHYDKHLMWPYAGIGYLSLLLPETREKMDQYLLENLSAGDKHTERILKNIKLVAEYLAKEATKITPGVQVLSCMDDLYALRNVEVKGLHPVHIAYWLRNHLAPSAKDLSKTVTQEILPRQITPRSP